MYVLFCLLRPASARHCIFFDGFFGCLYIYFLFFCYSQFFFFTFYPLHCLGVKLIAGAYARSYSALSAFAHLQSSHCLILKYTHMYVEMYVHMYMDICVCKLFLTNYEYFVSFYVYSPEKVCVHAYTLFSFVKN